MQVHEDVSTLAWEATVSDPGRGIFGIDANRLGSFMTIRFSWTFSESTARESATRPIAKSADSSSSLSISGGS